MDIFLSLLIVIFRGLLFLCVLPVVLVLISPVVLIYAWFKEGSYWGSVRRVYSGIIDTWVELSSQVP
ncbi:MAG: hypothetical protein BWX54_02138 [Verrucomicrobia bacterium ADurb.Bin018]|jgi:hypothetical protein|nr:MAG: hypothetical protein BWX54_02138 [Verrucomicrobia bacterium ADurb.Bin018]